MPVVTVAVAAVEAVPPANVNVAVAVAFAATVERPPKAAATAATSAFGHARVIQ